jgi:hypothetical protein
MKIKVTHSFVYDTDNLEFWKEFEEYMDDHTLTFPSLQEFVIDRFINPNFDKGGKTEVELLHLTRCARCDSILTFHDTTPGYYATCPKHDEDLDRWECK